MNDLYIVKGNVDGTEEEIQASRISEVHGAVNLYGGRLRVEEQAVLKTTAGLAVAEKKKISTIFLSRFLSPVCPDLVSDIRSKNNSRSGDCSYDDVLSKMQTAGRKSR